MIRADLQVKRIMASDVSISRAFSVYARMPLRPDGGCRCDLRRRYGDRRGGGDAERGAEGCESGAILPNGDIFSSRPRYSPRH